MSKLKLFLSVRRFVWAKVLVGVVIAALVGGAIFTFLAPANATNQVAEAETQPVAEQTTESMAEPESEAESELTTEPTRQSVRTSVAETPPEPVYVDPSLPTYIHIDGAVSAAVTAVGLDGSGAIAVPNYSVGWWNGSAKLGQAGASFFDGHSAGVFSGLATVGIGAQIDVTMGDSSVISYRVVDRRVFDYDYDNPAAGSNNTLMRQALTTAHGGTDGLNLMTCAGYPVGNTYSQRLVVFALRI